MPADLRTMLAASDAHDTITGIEDRDLPQGEPRRHEIAAIADSIVAQFSVRNETVSTEDALIELRSDIIMAMLGVRFTASMHTATKTWEIVRRVLGR